jgi:hypothetical protein
LQLLFLLSEVITSLRIHGIALSREKLGAEERFAKRSELEIPKPDLSCKKMFARRLTSLRFFAKAAEKAPVHPTLPPIGTNYGETEDLSENTINLTLSMRETPKRTTGDIHYQLNEIVRKFCDRTLGLNLGHAHTCMLHSKIVFSFGEFVNLSSASRI